MNRVILALAASAALLSPAFAQTYSEPLYDPPIGSRWQVLSQADSEDMRGAEKRNQHVTTRSELVIEQKLDDGFRVSFVIRDVSVTGNMPGSEIAGPAFGAMKDIVVRARTDGSGKPVEIENLPEVRGTMRVVIDRIVASMQDKPKVAAVMKDLLEKTLLVDGHDAARAYIEDVPLLVVGQNTGLAPAASRREIEEAPNPLGGTIKSIVTTRLDSWDAATGKRRYVRTRDTDPEALKAFVVTVVRKIVPATDKDLTPKMIEIMQQIKFDMSSRAIFDVEAGMTRRIEETTNMTVSLMGHSGSKIEKKVIEVTPLLKAQ